MRNRAHPAGRLAVLAILVACATLAGAGFEETRSIDTDRLVLKNLIGEVTVTGHDGRQFEVRVIGGGGDATPERLRLETSDGGQTLEIVFPLDESRDYVYPRLSSRSRIRFTPDEVADRGWLSSLFGLGSSRHVRVAPSGSGLELWADVEVRVPRDGDIDVRLGVGAIRAADLRGRVNLDTSAGDVVVRGMAGSLRVDTGSGNVEVENANGPLLVDTGSGEVTAKGCDGKVEIDTGSGGVVVEDITGPRLFVDTGSGGVFASRIDVRDVEIDTGSGGVRLELSRLVDGKVSVDTGSGSIDLLVPPDASLDLRADTGSGSIDLDLGESAEVLRSGRNEVELRVGFGGAKVDLDAGSGTIRIAATP